MASGYGTFYEVFARFYDALRPEREGELEFYRAQAAASDGGALEIGCGTGRVLLPVARSGIETWGVDSSPAMLRLLEAKIARLECETPGLAARIVLREGDMRSFSLGRTFGAVLIPYHTFQHLLSREDQLACLACVREHLVAGGRLALDVAGFDPSLLRRRRGPLCLERRETIRDPDVPGEIESVFSAEIDTRTGLAVQTRTLSRGMDVLLRAGSNVKYLREGEVAAVLSEAGFAVIERSGGFAREPLCPGGEQVWVAERR